MNFTRKFLRDWPGPGRQGKTYPVSELTNRILPTHSVQKNDIIFKTGYSSSGDFKFNNLLYIWYWKEFLTVTKSEMFLVKKTLFIGHLW